MDPMHDFESARYIYSTGGIIFVSEFDGLVAFYPVG